jgi:peptidoglycan/LPS O-acetylase OafA/YrhL
MVRISSQSVRRLRHVPGLDGLRGIAILLVLLNHSGLKILGGGLGVDLFFCLSGFLITALLLSEWSERGSISFTDFYRRRALRLLPALLLVSAVTLAFYPEAYRQALIGVTYVANFARLSGDSLGSFGHFWSLAQEEQFYLVWPLALTAMLRFPRIIVPSLGMLFVAISVHGLTASSYERLWYGPDMHSGGLVLGALAAVLYVRGGNLRLPVSIAVLVSVLCVAIFSLSTARSVLPVFDLSAAVLVLAVAQGSLRSLELRPLRYVGKISYGLYLWHVPVFIAIGWEVGLPVSIVCASLSYRYIEQPFLRRKVASGWTARPTLEPASA